MAKVTIKGEVFEWDFARRPMSEMLALEKALGMLYGEWESQFRQGGAKATAGFIWLVWHRNGKQIAWADFWGPLEAGTADFDVIADFDIESDPEPDPTTAPGSQGASTTTGTNTSERSRKS